MTKETIIGEISIACDVTRLCSIEDLKEEVRRKDCRYTARQYCDFRYSTNLQRFNYDPFTGKKIDWKRVMEIIT